VIAEDEALLRDALAGMLRESWPELEIVAACEDGASALEAIASFQPDVAFLDIRMPGLTGLEVASSLLDAGVRTEVVFVTAYDQYAIDAFERGAVDYLLKPVARERPGPGAAGGPAGAPVGHRAARATRHAPGLAHRQPGQ
jgi:DNA-binding LytR/AlgR family response regulator